jgi:pimeloyl-ACP methyl ester carboxylesterase
MKKGYVDIPEGQIHYRTAGEGENLLMLHQTPTSSEEYIRLIPLLAQKFRVYAMDTMGYGNSDAPPRTYGIEDYAASIIAFMDALGIQKTHVFGHHTGAILAVELATRIPERIGKIVVSGCPQWDAAERKKHLENPAYAHVVLDEEGRFLTTKWNTYKSFCAPGAKPETWFPSFAASVICGTRVHDGHIAAFKYDILSRFPKVPHPVLLVSGERDMFLGDLEATAALFPNARTGVIKGGGVLVCLEASEALSKAIIDFI